MILLPIFSQNFGYQYTSCKCCTNNNNQIGYRISAKRILVSTINQRAHPVLSLEFP